jgi:Tol biopolymer transport system component/DNA-binding winged helix-turn-helix (wHTH) protein
MTGNGADRVRFGPFEANLRTFELRREGVRIRLSGQPFQVLGILLERPGELITREELQARIWKDDTFVDFSHGMNSAVNKLREALCDSAQEPRYVETLPRRGYRFIAEVKVLTDEIPSREVEPESVVEESVQNPQPEKSKRNLRFYLTMAIGLILLILGLIAFANLELENVRLSRNSALFAIAAFVVVLVLGALRTYGLKKLGGLKGKALYPPIAGAVLVLLVTGIVITRLGGSKDAQAVSIPQRVKPLTQILDPTAFPSFSSDGRYAAFYREGRTAESAGIYMTELGSEQLKQLSKGQTDASPVWSPDGQYVAFTRRAETKDISIYVVPSGVGGSVSKQDARKLELGSVSVRRREIDWSPDGEHIAFDGGSGIFVISVKDSSLKKITEPGPFKEDWGPTFSADGKRMLFVRSGETATPDEIRIVPAEGGETVVVLSEQGKIQGAPQWSADAQSVVFASLRNGASSLWKVAADTREAPVQFNYEGWEPAVSKRAHHLAFTRVVHGLNVWTMDIENNPTDESHVLISSASQTDQGPGPQYSPDGTKIAFMSDRSGTMEIWVADRDGNSEYQLTAVGDAGTPRWSPDSRSIVFDASGKETRFIYSISLAGGSPKMLTEDKRDAEADCPSWSRDGKWIYFASKHQVWKMPANGGAATQITQQGGHAGFESPDGKYFYYAKTFYSNPSIWQVPVDGGKEMPVTPQLRPASWASWTVVDRGIVFAGSLDDGRPAVSMYDFASHKVKKVASLQIVPFWLTATADGKRIAFDKQGWMQPQVMLVENFK